MATSLLQKMQFRVHSVITILYFTRDITLVQFKIISNSLSLFSLGKDFSVKIYLVLLKLMDKDLRNIKSSL